MNKKNLILIVAVAIAIIGAVWYHNSKDESVPATESTTAPVAAPAEPAAEATPEAAPAETATEVAPEPTVPAESTAPEAAAPATTDSTAPATNN